MPHLGPSAVRQALTGYYAATALFLALDLGLGINLRVSFLEAHDGWRLAYYGVCLACLIAIIVRPGWTIPVSALESLATMVALILSFGVRVMAIDDAVLEGSEPVVTTQEVLNFLISGVAAWLAWTRSIAALSGRG